MDIKFKIMEIMNRKKFCTTHGTCMLILFLVHNTRRGIDYSENYIPNLSFAKKKGFKQRISLNKQIKEAIITKLENNSFSKS